MIADTAANQREQQCDCMVGDFARAIVRRIAPGMPTRPVASRSTLSKPTPARTITRHFGISAMKSASIRISCHAMMPSAFVRASGGSRSALCSRQIVHSTSDPAVCRSIAPSSAYWASGVKRWRAREIRTPGYVTSFRSSIWVRGRRGLRSSLRRRPTSPRPARPILRVDCVSGGGGKCRQAHETRSSAPQSARSGSKLFSSEFHRRRGAGPGIDTPLDSKNHGIFVAQLGCLQRDPLNLVERDFLGALIVKLRCPRARMVRHLGGTFKIPAVFK